MAQGVAVYAALQRAADTCADGRGRGQVMADTLVERVTGRPAEVPVPVAVNLVITDETLLAGDDRPGPDRGLRAGARGGRAASDRRPRWTTGGRGPRCAGSTSIPRSGALVAMESRAAVVSRRAWPRFIDLRDDTCRTPYCDAPIRHHDHATAHDRGGHTSAVNGLGECERVQLRQGSPRLDGHHHIATRRVATPPNSPHPPARDTDPPHPHYRARCTSTSARSKSASASTSPNTPPNPTPEAPRPRCRPPIRPASGCGGRDETTTAACGRSAGCR